MKTPTNLRNTDKEESKSPNISFKNKKDVSNHKIKRVEDTSMNGLTSAGGMTPKSKQDRSGLKMKNDLTIKK
jgi:hypothetical protein